MLTHRQTCSRYGYHYNAEPSVAMPQMTLQALLLLSSLSCNASTQLRVFLLRLELLQLAAIICLSSQTFAYMTLDIAVVLAHA